MKRTRLKKRAALLAAFALVVPTGTVLGVAESAAAATCSGLTSTDKVSSEAAAAKYPTAPMRTGNGEVCGVITNIPYGATVNPRCWRTNEFDNIWYSVSYGGKTGWVWIQNLAYAPAGLGAKC